MECPLRHSRKTHANLFQPLEILFLPKFTNEGTRRPYSHIGFLQQSARLCEARRVMVAHRLLQTLINYHHFENSRLHLPISDLNSSLPGTFSKNALNS